MLLDFLFPRRCLGCGKWGRYFCENCLIRIEPIRKQICPVCEKLAISGKTHARCQTRYSLDGLTSVFPYRGAIKEAITKLKYKFVTDLAEDLINTVPNSLFTIRYSSTSTLIPVPLHPRRQRWRGFNQAELLGRMLAVRFNWSVRSDILVRHRNTQPQIKLKGKKRTQNIKGAFKISPESRSVKLKLSNVLLFDDVWTTGSTLKECGRVLKKGGAQWVWGITLAR